MNCPLCHKTFSTTQVLKYHIDNNVCIKKKTWEYKCSICNKLFANKSNLNRHIKLKICTTTTIMSIDSQMTPNKSNHVCDYCNKTFSKNSNLHRHMRSCKARTNQNDSNIESKKSLDILEKKMDTIMNTINPSSTTNINTTNIDTQINIQINGNHHIKRLHKSV